MPPSVWLPVTGNVLAGLIAGVIAGIIAPIINHRFSEASRERDRSLEREKEKQSKALEEQRHRLDIYKIIFTEQIAVVKRLSELIGIQYLDAFVFFGRQNKDGDIAAREQSALKMLDRAVEISTATHSNIWLLGSMIRDEVIEFTHVITTQVGVALSEQGMSDGEAVATLSIIKDHFDTIGKALDNHMHGSTLSVISSELPAPTKN